MGLWIASPPRFTANFQNSRQNFGIGTHLTTGFGYIFEISFFRELNWKLFIYENWKTG